MQTPTHSTCINKSTYQHGAATVTRIHIHTHIENIENPSAWNKQNGCMPFGSPGKWILLTEQLASSRQDNLYSIHHLYYSRPSFSLRFTVALQLCVCVFSNVRLCIGTCVYEYLLESVKNSVEPGPWGTCEVFNVVKQVQRDRKGSPASARRLALWVEMYKLLCFPSPSLLLPFSRCVSPPVFVYHSLTQKTLNTFP